MSPITRVSCLLLSMGSLGCVIQTTGRAQAPQPPASQLPAGQLRELQMPAGVLPQPSAVDPNRRGNAGDEPRELKRLRDAVEGKFKAGSSGDVVLDEIIDLLQREGSVADRLPSEPTLDRQSIRSRASTGGNAAARVTVKRKAMAAEQLLRAARILEGLTAIDSDLVEDASDAAAIATAEAVPDDPGETELDQSDLIRRMRAHAARLLTE